VRVARRRKGRRKRNWDDVYIRDFDGAVRKPNTTERRLVRHPTPFYVADPVFAVLHQGQHASSQRSLVHIFDIVRD
jgi:hypothetical protein